MNVTLQQVIKNCSKTPKVKLKRLMALKKYYLSMYRVNMLRLYSLDYISDPTRYNEKEIIKNFIDFGIIADITSVENGQVVVSMDSVEFAIYKNKWGDELIQFLYLLYDVLKYKGFAEQIDVIHDEYKFFDTDNAKVKIQMIQKGAMVVQKSGLVYDEAMARVYSPWDTETQFVSVNRDIWSICMSILGIPEEDWYKDGLFDKELTHEEEVECAEGILNGILSVNGGKYLKNLKHWLMNHKWSSTAKFQADMKGLYDFVYCDKVRELEVIFDEKLKNIDGDILAIHKDRIYYNIPRTTLELPIGVFTVMCDMGIDEELLSTGNAIYGYTGEVYTTERLVADGESWIGCPISVVLKNNKLENVYDLEQTGIQSETWLKYSENCIEFSEEDANAMPYNPFNMGKLDYMLYNAYKNSLADAKFLTFYLQMPITESELSAAFKRVYKVLEGI